VKLSFAFTAYDMIQYFRYKMKVRDRMVIRELIFI